MQDNSNFDVENKRVVRALPGITDNNAIIAEQFLAHINDLSNPHHVNLGQLLLNPSITGLSPYNSMAALGGKLHLGPQVTTLMTDLPDSQLFIETLDTIALGSIVVLEGSGNLEYLRIKTSTALPTGYRLEVDRNLDGSGANNWYTGATVFSSGTTNQFFMSLYPGTGFLSAHTGPTLAGFLRTGTAYSSIQEQWAIGNLKGLYGYSSNTFGVVIGPYSASNEYLIITSSGIQIVSQGQSMGHWTSAGVVIGNESLSERSFLHIDSNGNLRIKTTDPSESILTRFELLNTGEGYLGNGNIAWDASGNSRICTWYIETNYLHDLNNRIILQTGTALAPASNRILIDGGVAGGRITVGSSIVLLGTGAGSISVGSIAIDGSGIITGGLIRTAASGSRIELSATTNCLDLINNYTVSRIKPANYGLIIDDDINGVYTSYSQYFQFSNSGLQVFKKQTDTGWLNAFFGKLVENSYGSLIRVWKEDATHAYTAESFSISRSALTTGWAIQWGTDTTDPDTNLYRASANLLKTDDSLHITNQLGIGTAPNSSYRILLPTGTTIADGIRFGDIDFYRVGANNLRADSGIHSKSQGETTWGTGFRLIRQGTSTAYFDIQFGSTGQVLFGSSGTQYGNINTSGLWYFNMNLQVGTSILAAGTILTSDGGIGYTTGAGGTVTQTSFRTSGVTINELSGAITLVSATGSTTWNSFTVTNSTVAATDVIIINQKSGTDLYEIHITNVAAGSFKVSFRTTGGTTTEQPVFSFAVIKGVTS